MVTLAQFLRQPANICSEGAGREAIRLSKATRKEDDQLVAAKTHRHKKATAGKTYKDEQIPERPWLVQNFRTKYYLQIKDEVVEAFLGYAVMEANCKRSTRGMLHWAKYFLNSAVPFIILTLLLSPLMHYIISQIASPGR